MSFVKSFLSILDCPNCNKNTLHSLDVSGSARKTHLMGRQKCLTCGNEAINRLARSAFSAAEPTLRAKSNELVGKIASKVPVIGDILGSEQARSVASKIGDTLFSKAKSFILG